MENDKLVNQQNADEKSIIIMEQFNIAIFALQLQDSQSCEQAFLKASLVYKKYKEDIDNEYDNYLKIIVSFIEVTSRLIKSNLYISDERHKKALEELVAIKQISDNVAEIFKSFTPEFLSDVNEDGKVTTIKFLFAFFEHIVKVNHGITQKNVELEDGKYIDEIGMYRLASIEVKQFEIEDYYSTNPEFNDIIVSVSGWCNRTADIFEKKADRIEEKRKVIEFLRPIDNKVFIIHGHNEGTLRELNDILEKNFKIDPIILKEELDKGKTIIEKVEEYGRQCAFAFAIITPDDIVENKKTKSLQARPNVLFELGWFCGRYGRDKVRILKQGNTVLPSDLGGIISFDFNERISEVFLNIKSDLESNGLL